MSRSGYGECACCSEVIVLDDVNIPELCNECASAECGVDCTDCTQYTTSGDGQDPSWRRCAFFKRFLSKGTAESPKNNCRGFSGGCCCQRPDAHEEEMQTPEERLAATKEELALTVEQWEARFGSKHPGPNYTETLKAQQHRLEWELLPAPRPPYVPYGVA